MFQNCLFC